MDKSMLLVENGEKRNTPMVMEVGEVKRGFTTKVGASEALLRAKRFLPMMAEANKGVTVGEKDVDIEPLDKSNPTSEDTKKETTDGKCYVEMDIALGVLEEKGSGSESECCIEEI
ncbi:hypothetical protein EIN_246860 [Entamoeba invadens IP1]|uniref:Uncharacterized protein n=1 Tax=Entamoeba invadens IP1 TaxID=370355 RepID=A0A0A1UH67_ENTIV|nr:hypothetical protein EIN_246860 [Entamoeba invadens IP1]ELP94792.1 hypothetical protein EIN_246860 [Entamoeba invadens IP1]|eukprot:XP_004261563.1 hypothetical protein EIN_246860 [Entamoeba invadens IP1]